VGYSNFSMHPAGPVHAHFIFSTFPSGVGFGFGLPIHFYHCLSQVIKPTHPAK